MAADIKASEHCWSLPRADWSPASLGLGCVTVAKMDDASGISNPQ